MKKMTTTTAMMMMKPASRMKSCAGVKGAISARRTRTHDNHVHANLTSVTRTCNGGDDLSKCLNQQERSLLPTLSRITLNLRRPQSESDKWN